MWHEISDIKRSGETDISASSLTGENSLWFDGHFDDKAILPGIAQTAMVFEALAKSESLKGHSGLKLKSVKRVRFRRLVSPGEKLDISIKKNPDSADIYNFKIYVNNELTCSGIIETGI